MIVFVGDKPSPKMKPGARPFEGAVCEKRLKEWLQYMGVHDYEIYNSDNEDYLRAILMASAHQYPGCKYIALGNVAANRLSSVVWLSNYFVLPHPSGRNRQINNEEFIKLQLDNCKEWLSK